MISELFLSRNNEIWLLSYTLQANVVNLPFLRNIPTRTKKASQKNFSVISMFCQRMNGNPMYINTELTYVKCHTALYFMLYRKSYAKMHLRYVSIILSSSFSNTIAFSNRDPITHKRERPKVTGLFTSKTANYVSKWNSRANGKFPRARTSMLLRSSNPFSLRGWSTIRKINLYLKFSRCVAPRKRCTDILNVILTVFTSLRKKLSQFTFSSFILSCWYSCWRR